MRALQQVASLDRQPTLILPTLLEQLADRHESASALESSDGSLTYRELTRRCNQFARWGLLQELRSGDTVCLVMLNSVEYLPIWLGLIRIGVRVALVNTHLSGDALAHAINLAAPSLVIADPSTATNVARILGMLLSTPACWVLGQPSEDMRSIDPLLLRALGEPLTVQHCSVPVTDATALLIYTSGTTGPPKAAKISHRRLMRWSHWFAGMMDTGPEDRMYNCLPLYHSVGGIVATGATLVGGGAVVIRKRFSASDFWRDIRDERCTLFQYIGELCRYLVASPAQPAEREHLLRLACGNGLRADIWERFKTRFDIPRVLEYYAATEGTFSLYNCEEQPGAIGRIPPYLRHRMAVELVHLDADREQPRRDAQGFCRRCDINEVGEAVGTGHFEGYTDMQASERKILKHVFAEGDAWYRTGDLMRCDENGFYYFVDRVGDTYRWKGENVAASEVLTALLAMQGVLDGVVYGVTVPGTDGRAGMAALRVDATFNLADFRKDIAHYLPAYARPLFLRLITELPATSTFKPIKQDLMRTHFDPALVTDPLYFDSKESGAYVVLDPVLYATIVSGGLRL